MIWALGYLGVGMVSVFAYVWAMLDTELRPSASGVLTSFAVWPVILPSLAAAWLLAEFKVRRAKSAESSQ